MTFELPPRPNALPAAPALDLRSDPVVILPEAAESESDAQARREAALHEWENQRAQRKQERENARRAKRALLEVSPSGRHAKRAEDAWDKGDKFLEVVLSLGSADARWGDHVSSRDLQPDPVGHVLSMVQEVGWELNHVGYVFKPSLTVSANPDSKTPSVGGEILGVFLFRKPESRRRL